MTADRPGQLKLDEAYQASYRETQSWTATGREFGVSPHRVRRAVMRFARYERLHSAARWSNKRVDWRKLHEFTAKEYGF